MKHILLLLAILHTALTLATPARKEINEGWVFRQARLGNWHPAIVPGVVHTDLIANGIIDDPFLRLNERGVQWVDKEDWIYETIFSLPSEMQGRENIRLHFKGLDTYADVYLNDEKILEADNMFREWKVNVTPLIKTNGNKLRVYFHSPIKKALPEWEALPFQYRSSNDQSENGGVFDRKVGVFTRKAGYHYGWDWGPRLVTSGIWRPVILEAWDNARLENVQIVQHNVTSKSVDIQNIVEVTANRDIKNAKIQVLDQSVNKVLGERITDLAKGLNKVTVNFRMKNPKLWWSNGLGDAYLYRFGTQLLIDAQIADQQTDRIGIRSIKVFRQPDKYGIGFHFELNGVPIFTKGANYIPCDNFLPRVTKDIYKRMIMDAVNANMNMLRVWGGGTYEDDYFYDLCDEHGILIWQDFMFACSVYPAEGKLLENIRQEVIDNVRRLRNHPSIALWCGNNEIMDALFNWGGGWLNVYRKQNPEYAETVWKQYYDLFHVVLPEVVKEYDPLTYYLPSSPFSDMEGTRDEKAGDYHYWATWQKGLPLATFNDAKSRYFSEYGFQSFPIFETVRKYALESTDWDIYSEVMMWHQRGGMNANKTIEKSLLNEYGKPKDFKSFLYMSQLLQGDAIKTAMEAHRRNMPYCMGSLYWQLNDCWPVASWSSRDYYGRWKAQHYYARKAFDDILVSPIEEDDSMSVFIVSDRLKDFKAELSVSVITMDGTIISKWKKTVAVPKNTSTNLFSKTSAQLLNGKSRGDVVLYAELMDSSKKTYRNVYYFTQQRNMNYLSAAVNRRIDTMDGGFNITLSSDRFARGVYMSTDDDSIFEDDFFDLLPNKSIFVKVKSSLSKEEFERQLKITSLNESIIK